MGKIQKVYTREFKEEAVRLAQTSGKPITQIARELGISDSTIHSSRKELAEHGTEAFPGKGHQNTLEEEISRLKRELERVQQERIPPLHIATIHCIFSHWPDLFFTFSTIFSQQAQRLGKNTSFSPSFSITRAPLADALLSIIHTRHSTLHAHTPRAPSLLPKEQTSS